MVQTNGVQKETRESRLSFRRGFITCLFLIVSAWALLGLVNWIALLQIKRHAPNQEDGAKISQILGLEAGETIKVEKFDFVFLQGGPDAYGTCAFILERTELSPPWSKIRSLWKPIEHSFDRPNTGLTLIRWMSDELYKDVNRPSYRKTLIEYPGLKTKEGKPEVGDGFSQDCLAFFDNDTSPSKMYVSVDGNIFKKDMAFAVK